MPGKILIVDSVATNRIVLKVKLSSAFYQVAQAATAAEAMSIIQSHPPDLVLLSDDLCDGQKFGLCESIRSNLQSAHTPIIVLATNPDRTTRMQALIAGANDIIPKPMEDKVLLARLRSVLRSSETTEDLHLRDRTAHLLGFSETSDTFGQRVNVLFATPNARTGLTWSTRLKPFVPFALHHTVLRNALRGISKTPPDIFIIAPDPDAKEDSLRLLAEIRAHAGTRQAGIIFVMQGNQPDTLIDALDLGANDVMTDGFDAEEIALRISSLVSQKRLADRLRKNVHDGLAAAVIDPLTGLFNRRYALPHLARITSQSQKRNTDIAVMVADLDHFKRINDRYGHAVGDAVLTDIAQRFRENLRASDMVARIGGEEFLIAMPDTSRQEAIQYASTLCEAIGRTPVYLRTRDLQIPITISIGLAMSTDCIDPRSTTANDLIERADRALYGAKSTGRNQVSLSRPAA